VERTAGQLASLVRGQQWLTVAAGCMAAHQKAHRVEKNTECTNTAGKRLKLNHGGKHGERLSVS